MAISVYLYYKIYIIIFIYIYIIYNLNYEVQDAYEAEKINTIRNTKNRSKANKIRKRKNESNVAVEKLKFRKWHEPAAIPVSRRLAQGTTTISCNRA